MDALTLFGVVAKLTLRDVLEASGMTLQEMIAKLQPPPQQTPTPLLPLPTLSDPASAAAAAVAPTLPAYVSARPWGPGRAPVPDSIWR